MFSSSLARDCALGVSRAFSPKQHLQGGRRERERKTGRRRQEKGRQERSEERRKEARRREERRAGRGNEKNPTAREPSSCGLMHPAC